MNLDDTIAAISSAVGPAARMIVRISGASGLNILRGICPGEIDFSSATARRLELQFSDLKCPAWIYTFVAPRSYTGQDLIELHIPGNPLLARMLLDEIVRTGARLADPGEFTARAYFNGRIDLSQAEGVAAAIAATSGQHLAAAQRLLDGELSRRLRPAMDVIAETLALVEVGIDFSEEDVFFLSVEQVKSRLDEVTKMLDELVGQSARFEKISHEPRVVLAGRPNAGKSTLMNVLAGRARAVVSPLAGTTRDVLSAPIALRRGLICLSDVAGIEESQSGGFIETQMQQRAAHEMRVADIVILVRDAADAQPLLEVSREPDLIVITKIDVLDEEPSPLPSPWVQGEGEIGISAHTGENIDELRERLDAIAFGTEAGGASLALNARHLHAIAEARAALAGALQSVGDNAAELVAADLRECLDSLGNILGIVSPDDILGRIFSTFCIGK